MPITIEHHKHIKVNTAKPLKVLELNDDALSRFCALGIIRRFAKKEVVFTAGSPADRVYYVASGKLSLLSPCSITGKKFIISHVQPGEFVGEASFNLNSVKVRSHALVSDISTDLIEISVSDLKNALNNELKDISEEIKSALTAQSVLRFDAAIKKMSCMADSGVRGRVLQVLVDLSNEPQSLSHPKGRQIKVSRQDLARLCGCSREMAGRVLKQLQDESILSATGKTIVIFEQKK